MPSAGSGTVPFEDEDPHPLADLDPGPRPDDGLKPPDQVALVEKVAAVG
jgi:hypothetical protein